MQRVSQAQRVTRVQCVGYLSGEEAAHWKLSLTILESATKSLRPSQQSQWQRFSGRQLLPGRGEAVWWKLSLTILNSTTESLQLALQRRSVTESRSFSRRDLAVRSQSVVCLSGRNAERWKLCFTILDYGTNTL